MRALLLIIFLSFVTITATAQQIPNGSFRYWSSIFAPDGWGTWASSVGFGNQPVADSLSKLAVKDTTAFDYITDSAALRLTVDTVTLPSQGLVTLAGFASLGGASYIAPPSGLGLQFGYLRYGSFPDTLYFDYMSTGPAGNDSAAVVMTLTRYDSITNMQVSFLSATWLLPASTQWTRNYALPLAGLYNNSIGGSPDSLQLIFFASVSSAPQRGCTLWVDSLHFDASVNPIIVHPAGMADIGGRENGIYTYPNPASESFNIIIPEREKGSTMKLYDAEGREVLNLVLKSTHNQIDAQELMPGIYALVIYSIDRLTRYKGSITISK